MQIKNLSATMKHFKFFTFSATLLVIFLLADCGGGGSTTPPPTLSFSFLTDANLRSCAQATGATSISEVTTLDCSGRVISNLTGIDQLTSLTSLNLNNNNIDNDGVLILANMTWLVELYLSNNSITDIGALTALDGLTDLTLSGNTITDFNQLLTILGDIDLVNLNLGSVGDLSSGNSNFADLITTLTGMSATLRSLRLDNNQIDVIPATFSNLNFLTGLTLDNNDITNITNLQLLDSLVSLHLYNNNLITDISPLSNAPIPPLTELTFAGGDIGSGSGFSYLNDFPNLAVLRLKNTGFDDADMAIIIATLLPNLVNMTTIDLTGGGNGTITNTLPLAAGLALTELVLSNNPGIGAHADNFDALGSLDNLTILNLNNTGFESGDFPDLSAQTITNLTELNLSTNVIGSGFFGPINAMTSLVTLKLNDTGFADADFSALPNVLPNLTSLSLDSNNIVDATPYAALTNLNTLSLASNAIDNTVPNVSSLTTLTSADSIELSDNIGMSCNDLTTLIDGLATGVVSPAPAADGVNCTDP